MCVLIALIIVVIIAIVANKAAIKISGQSLIYEIACKCAATTGKPLVVIGDPYAAGTLNAWFGTGYDCGDLCIDMNVAPKCPRQYKGLIQDWLRKQPDNSAVIFESEVLIYIPQEELSETLQHLYRVSGGDLFSSHSNIINVKKYAKTGKRQRPRFL